MRICSQYYALRSRRLAIISPASVGVVSSRDLYHQAKIERKTPGLCYSLLVNREMVQLKRFVPLKMLRKKKRLQNWHRLKKTKYFVWTSFDTCQLSRRRVAGNLVWLATKNVFHS